MTSMDNEFFEFAEHQLDSPVPPQDYLSSYSIFSCSSPHDVIAAAMTEAMNELHDLEEEFQKQQQREATPRNRRVAIRCVSLDHQVTAQPRPWWNPANWFKPTQYIATFVSRVEVWETDLDTDE